MTSSPPVQRLSSATSAMQPAEGYLQHKHAQNYPPLPVYAQDSQALTPQQQQPAFTQEPATYPPNISLPSHQYLQPPFQYIQPLTAAAPPPQPAYINPPLFNYSQPLHERPPVPEGRFRSYTQSATAVETARQNSIARHPLNKKKPATLTEKNTLARVIFHARTLRPIIFNDMKVEGLWETVDIQQFGMYICVM